jgi:hypothetical protein
MLKKENLLNEFKENYKPSFLLAWGHYLTYDELKKTDNLEAYEAEKLAKRVKKIADWNSKVLEYNEENIKRSLCIAVYNAIENAEIDADFLNLAYVNDIQTWLDILEDKSFKMDDHMSSKELIAVYNKISDKYKFNL